MSRLPRWEAAAALALLSAAAFAGYQQIFSTLAPYDDEGYVMLSVAFYLHGLPLYEEIYTQYGPALFVVEGGFHRLTGLPITHDVVRLRTLALWLATALLTGAAAGRLTRSWAIGLAAGAMGFLHLERLCLEPGHPQELCAPAVMGSILLASYLPRGARRGWIPLGLGVVIGLTLMTKLNIGAFLLAGVLLAMALAAPPGRFGKAAKRSAVAAAIVLPVAVAHKHAATPEGWPLPVAVLCSAAALGAVGLPRRSADPPEAAPAAGDWPTLPTAAWAWLLAGIAVACGAMAAVVLARGVSPESLWYGLAGQHRRFAGPFYHPAPVGAAAVLAALGGAAAGWAFRQSAAARVGLRLALATLLLAAAWRYLAETNTPLVHGLNDRGGAGLLVALATPWAWIVLLPQSASRRHPVAAASRRRFGLWGCVGGETPPLRDFGRLALCAIAVLQPLGAYPVPGTQMAVGSLPLIVIGLVALHDLARGLAADRARGVTAWAGRAAPLAAAVLLAAIVVQRDACLWRHRQALAPLGLPGAARLRVPQETARQTQAVVQELRRRGATFVFADYARNSFYFWTALPPPTALNATVWPCLLRPAEQRRIIAALEGRPVCLVREPYAAPPPPGEAPLHDYLARRFQFAAAHGRFELWTARSADTR